MSSNTFIQDNLIRHQIYLGRLGAGIANDAADIVNDIAEQATNMIGEGGNLVGDVRRIQFNMDEIINNSGLSSTIADSVNEIAGYESEYYSDLLGRGTTANINLVSPEGLGGVISDTAMFLTNTTGEVTTATIAGLLTTMDNAIGSQIINRVRAGITLGQTADEIVSDILRFSNKRTRAQVKSVVLTIINHTTAQARDIVFRANRGIFDGEIYVATLDSRTTWLCAQYDGQKFGYREGPHPPLHYRCRSLRRPNIRPEFNIPGISGQRPAVSLTKDGKRDIGQVDSRTTFQGWLRDQPKWFQDDYLGPTRAELFRSGKLDLPNFTDENGGIITLKDLRDKDGMPVI